MSDHKLIVHEQVKSPVAEAYRTLRTNLQFSKINSDLKLVMFTSSGPGEGKSTTASNTAVAMAQAGKKVLVVDCDLRKPVEHRIFGRKNRGLTNYMVEDLALEELIQETEIPGLEVLTSGPIPPNPSELLGSTKMAELLKKVREQFDLVIVDAPPVLAVTDACVLASKVDGIALVVSSGKVRPEITQQAKDLLVKAHGYLLGVVLNRVEFENKHAYYYYYYSDDGQQHKHKHKHQAV
jgi:capsular exopolysaccharide synthesis family protein